MSYKYTGMTDMLVGDGPVISTEVKVRPLLHKLQSRQQGIRQTLTDGLAPLTCLATVETSPGFRLSSFGFPYVESEFQLSSVVESLGPSVFQTISRRSPQAAAQVTRAQLFRRHQAKPFLLQGIVTWSRWVGLFGPRVCKK